MSEESSQTPTNKINRARKLRRESTFPERLLWGKLRAGRLNGVKFRRQHPIDPYIVDFCCPDAMLVIELDGLSHVGRGDADNMRSQYLEKLGYRVIRYTNDEVLSSLDSVIEDIEKRLG